ncbi:MAG: hypothetical protein WBQ25_23155 [Nitrososphaeraceae archaeon]
MCLGKPTELFVVVLISVILMSSVIAPGVARAQATTNSGNTPWQEFGVFFGPIQKHTVLS